MKETIDMNYMEYISSKFCDMLRLIILNEFEKTLLGFYFLTFGVFTSTSKSLFLLQRASQSRFPKI